MHQRRGDQEGEGQLQDEQRLDEGERAVDQGQALEERGADHTGHADRPGGATDQFPEQAQPPVAGGGGRLALEGGPHGIARRARDGEDSGELDHAAPRLGGTGLCPVPLQVVSSPQPMSRPGRGHAEPWATGTAGGR